MSTYTSKYFAFTEIRSIPQIFHGDRDKDGLSKAPDEAALLQHMPLDGAQQTSLTGALRQVQQAVQGIDTKLIAVGPSKGWLRAPIPVLTIAPALNGALQGGRPRSMGNAPWDDLHHRKIPYDLVVVGGYGVDQVVHEDGKRADVLMEGGQMQLREKWKAFLTAPGGADLDLKLPQYLRCHQ